MFVHSRPLLTCKCQHAMAEAERTSGLHCLTATHTHTRSTAVRRSMLVLFAAALQNCWWKFVACCSGLTVLSRPATARLVYCCSTELTQVLCISQGKLDFHLGAGGGGGGGGVNRANQTRRGGGAGSGKGLGRQGPLFPLPPQALEGKFCQRWPTAKNIHDACMSTLCCWNDTMYAAPQGACIEPCHPP